MRKDNRGFTIVELIVSLALLAVILVPVAGFFTNSFKIQGRTSMKSSITRVGQYIMENLKNKNYLENELKNGSGETFAAFVEGISLLNSDDGAYSLDPSVNTSRNWKINYKGVDYSVDIAISGFTTSDMSDFEIPEKDDCDGQVKIEEDGKISSFAYDGGIFAYNEFDTFENPIDNKSYTADCPTIVLRTEYPRGEKATLWIENSFGAEGESWKEIRIIKEFKKEELQVYIEGDNVSISMSQNGDGASSSQKRFTSSYVGEKVESGKKSVSELLLDAKMIITRLNDESVRDTFEFSFPVDYDYSKKGE